MAIIVDNDTRLVVQGLTGREGSFHGLRNRAYGTQVVAGVTPGKGGTDVEGVPMVVRLDGTSDEEGRKLLSDANPPGVFVERTMLDAARRAVELAAAGT